MFTVHLCCHLVMEPHCEMWHFPTLNMVNADEGGAASYFLWVKRRLETISALCLLPHSGEVASFPSRPRETRVAHESEGTVGKCQDPVVCFTAGQAPLLRLNQLFAVHLMSFPGRRITASPLRRCVSWASGSIPPTSSRGFVLSS